jgi:hypothetical protein
MALVGRLEDLELTELFHVLSLFQKSGSLTLRGADTTGVFRFRRGKIVHAANGAPRPTLGSLLLERGVVTRETLDSALRTQADGERWRRLGTILAEGFGVSTDVIESVIREQLQDTTEGFLHMRTGFFSFRPDEEDDAETDDRSEDDIELESGMNTDQFILDLLTRLDEVHAVQGPAPDARGPSAIGPAAGGRNRTTRDMRRLLDYMVDAALDGHSVDATPAAPDVGDGLDDLRSLMVEIQLRSPSFEGEIGLVFLRYASKVVDRGLLLHVAPTGMSPTGQFGMSAPDQPPESVARRLRSLRIPVDEPSVFLEVFESMNTVCGPLREASWNDRLVEQLGGRRPSEAVVIPIVVDGMIAGMFYGDNAATDRPIGSVQALELLAIEAGLAMERSLLRSRLRSVEDQLDELRADNTRTQPLSWAVHSGEQE